MDAASPDSNRRKMLVFATEVDLEKKSSARGARGVFLFFFVFSAHQYILYSFVLMEDDTCKWEVNYVSLNLLVLNPISSQICCV